VTDACAHCGLPVGRRSLRAGDSATGDVFCCYGCILAAEITGARGDAGVAGALLVRLGLALFLTMNVLVLAMPAYVPTLYAGAGPAADGPLFQVLRVLALVLAAPVLVLLGMPLARAAAERLRRGELGADLLIVLAATAAYGLSWWNTLAGGTEIYADTVCALLVLVTLGRYLEAQARARAGQAIRSLGSAADDTVTRRSPRGDERVPAGELRPGDVVALGPGASFPTDGVVVSGSGRVDEAVLTGEWAAVARGPGDPVLGGARSVDGHFDVRVLVGAAASLRARVAALVDEALRQPCRLQRVADRVAAVLTPLALLVAAGAGWWWAQDAGAAAGTLVALAVLVVACPCALGIATPGAIAVGLATAARRGVLVRSAPVLERLAAATDVCFDKTGTLTSSCPTVEEVVVAPERGWSATHAVAVAAALEGDLPHPLARAVAAHARAIGAQVPPATAVRFTPGEGLMGRVAGRRFRLGAAPSAAAGPVNGPRIELRDDAGVVARMQFREVARPEAAAALAGLSTQGHRCWLLTGDTAASAVVPALIPGERTAVGLRPDEKLRCIRALAGPGDRPVVMVGDGINDAPALAAAIGVTFADASALARHGADVVVLGHDLRQVPWLLAHARRVRRIMRQNLGWAIGYNALALVAAASGMLAPLGAAAAMIASSLTVTVNVYRLRARGDGAPSVDARQTVEQGVHGLVVERLVEDV